LRPFVRYWLPPLAWMALIWSVSSDLGSTDHSAGPFAWIMTALFPWATPAQIDLAHLIVRKTGHMVEYAILTALWFRTLSAGRRLPFTSSAPLALAISVVWAITDELHQSFVPSRTASAMDVIFDSTGAGLVLLALRLRNARFTRPTSSMESPLIAPTQNVSR
jgi:VanZ family protein